MDLNETWSRALRNTEIIRSRVKDLLTFEDTHVPYVLLSESSINVGDTVVRKGEVLVQRPALILPPNIPQLQGFDFEKSPGIDENAITNFLLIRGINMPSLKYNNLTYSLELYEDKLKSAIAHYQELLQQKEDVQTGLVVGPEDGWQFSLLIFICSQIVRNAGTDIQKLMEDYKKRAEGEK